MKSGRRGRTENRDPWRDDHVLPCPNNNRVSLKCRSYLFWHYFIIACFKHCYQIPSASISITGIFVCESVTKRNVIRKTVLKRETGICVSGPVFVWPQIVTENGKQGEPRHGVSSGRAVPTMLFTLIYSRYVSEKLLWWHFLVEISQQIPWIIAPHNSRNLNRMLNLQLK